MMRGTHDEKTITQQTPRHLATLGTSLQLELGTAPVTPLGVVAARMQASVKLEARMEATQHLQPSA